MFLTFAWFCFAHSTTFSSVAPVKQKESASGYLTEMQCPGNIDINVNFSPKNKAFRMCGEGLRD